MFIDAAERCTTTLTELPGGYISFRQTTIARKGPSSPLDAPVFIPDAINQSTVGHTYSGRVDVFLAVMPSFNEEQMEAGMGKEAYNEGEDSFQLGWNLC